MEDSEHVYETTMASLNALAHYVPVNGYLVVEDGAVDVEELRVEDDWPRGVLPALREWLRSPEGQTFTVRPRPGALRPERPPVGVPAAHDLPTTT